MNEVAGLALDKTDKAGAQPVERRGDRPGPLDHLRRLKESFTTPIWQRRWAAFKSNGRAYFSLKLFIGIFIVSMAAEFVANDKPIIARYKGEFLMPVLVDYPEEKFGGFLAVTDYKDPFIKEEIERNGWMIWPPIRYAAGSINRDYPRLKVSGERCLGFPAPPYWSIRGEHCDSDPGQLQRFSAVGNRNWLGTDDQGRDVAARVIYGLRISLLFGILLTIITSVIGIVSGAVQGYFGGAVDLVFQRILEIWASIPLLYVLIIISSVLVPGFWTLLFVLMAFQWTALVGVVRAEFLRGRNFEYIKAARALGLSDAKIMFKHLLPNAMVATLTLIPFKLSGSITMLTALDFLGLGLPPGSPSLGELLAQGKANLQAVWLGITAFLSLALILSLLNFIGEGVRDAFDERRTLKAN